MDIKQLPIEEEPRGINPPLTLAIILVAVTILVAAGLSFWATSLTTNKPAPVENDCIRAEFKLYSGNYDYSISTLSFVLDNSKEVVLKELNLYLIYPGERVEQKSLDGVLEGNTLKTFIMTGVERDFNKGVIKTHCSGVQVEFINQNGTLQQISTS